MTLYYLDTSALVKYYILEAGSTWVRDTVDALSFDEQSRVNAIFISDVSISEAAAAFGVLERTSRISRRTRDQVFRAYMHHIATGLLNTLPVGTADFYMAAAMTQSHPLKAYDAVQLAVALRYSRILASLHLSLVFVSGDRTLLAAARAEGLSSENPFDHMVPQDKTEVAEG